MKHLQEKLFEPQNNHKKKLWTQNIPPRKNFGTTAYPQENIWPTKYPLSHNGTRSTRPTMAGSQQNVEHSFQSPEKLYLLLQIDEQSKHNKMINQSLHLMEDTLPALTECLICCRIFQWKHRKL